MPETDNVSFALFKEHQPSVMASLLHRLADSSGAKAAIQTAATANPGTTPCNDLIKSVTKFVEFLSDVDRIEAQPPDLPFSQLVDPMTDRIGASFKGQAALGTAA